MTPDDAVQTALTMFDQLDPDEAYARMPEAARFASIAALHAMPGTPTMHEARRVGLAVVIALVANGNMSGDAA